MKRLEFEINKSILIIKGQENSLLAVESFLKNRDWKIHSTNSLKEALLYLVNNQPMFVLISADHPNPKIAKLPRVLTAAFPVCVVMFGESTSPAAYKKLSTHPAEYKLFPPVSGPAVERVVNKYIKDQTQKSAEANLKHRDGSSGAEGEGVISIRGASGDDDTRSFSNLSAQNLLKSMLSGGDSAQDESSFAHGGESYTQDQLDKSTSSYSKDKAQQTNGQWVPVDNQIHRQKGIGRGDEHGATDSKSSTHGNANEGTGKSAQNHLAQQDGTGSSPDQRAQEGNGPYNKYNAPSSQAPGPQYSEDDFLQPERKSPEDEDPLSGKSSDSISPSNRLNRNPNDTSPVNMREQPAVTVKDHFYHARGEDTIIAKGTQEALDKSSVLVKGAKTQNIDQATNVACIVIDSTRFSGYLVTAMGKDRRIDDEFIDKVKQRLFKFLKENGEDLDREDSALNIKIKQVDFEDWAVDCADFLRKSIHKGDEVAMAFFPHKNTKTKVGDSAAKHMATISIDEIKCDTALEFGVYVYLPKNDRYVLYTPEGGRFLGKQKDKLKSQGITELHIKKDDLQKISGHRAQTYLNDQIDRFNTNKLLNSLDNAPKNSA